MLFLAPVPRQQVIEAVVLVIVDAIEVIRQIRLGVEAVELRGLDDGERPGQGLAAGVRAREEPVAAADTQFPFILPMSGKSARSIIAGMPTSDRK